MAYFNDVDWVLEGLDYTYAGKTHAEHGAPSQVASVPAAYQASYTEGYNYGLHFKKYLNLLVP